MAKSKATQQKSKAKSKPKTKPASKPKKASKPKTKPAKPKGKTAVTAAAKPSAKKKVTARAMKIKAGERNVSTARAREICGGAFPRVSGRKYKYPAPSDAAAWTVLVNKALDMKAEDAVAMKKGQDRPVCTNRSQYEYILFHSNPRSRWKRSERTKHRRLHGLQVGDSRVVHHNDQRHMKFDKSEVLTPCEHQKVHGKECGRASYSRIRNCQICRNGKCKPCSK